MGRDQELVEPRIMFAFTSGMKGRTGTGGTNSWGQSPATPRRLVLP